MEAKQWSGAEIQSVQPGVSAVDGSDHKVDPLRKPMFGAVTGYFALTLRRQIERLTVGSKSFRSLHVDCGAPAPQRFCMSTETKAHYRSAHTRWASHPIAFLEKGSL